MGEYKLTNRGKYSLIVLAILGLSTIIAGSIYLAIFGFVFFSCILGVTIYEVFINK